MRKMEWFEREFTFGISMEMLPFLLDRLEGTALRLEHKINGQSDDVLSYKLDGKWSIKQNIGHLAEVDEIANKRIDEMTAGISPMSPAVFEPRVDYNALPIQEVVAIFKKARTTNINKYRGLSDAHLQSSSIHPRLKVSLTPVDLAYFDAEHDDHHLVRINEIISTHKA